MPDYSDKSDSKTQGISASNPGNQTAQFGGLDFNLTDEALSIFNPYAMLSAAQTFHSLNLTVNKMFGLESVWFRAVPEQRSKDFIFKEYTLSCVEEEPICPKVLIPDGRFPEDNYQYDLMGLEYQIPLEIHIDKVYWEEIAGFGTAPQKKDIVYLSLPNKLYQVESGYLKRQFMQQETTWVINLIKYQPEASRREGNALKDTIDKYTVSEEELFGAHQRAEIDKITNDKQMSPFNSTSEDKYKYVDKNLKIISGNIDIYGIIAAQSFYDLETSDSSTAIIYNGSDTILSGRDRTLTAWFYLKEKELKEYKVISIEINNDLNPFANYDITISGGANKFNIGDTFVIYRVGALNFYAKITDIHQADKGIYGCIIDEDVENYLNSIKSDWASLTNYKMKVKDPITIINGVDESNNTIFSVSIFANQYVKLTFGDQEKVARLNEKLDDNKWYAIVSNVSGKWNQYNFYIWEQHPTDKEQKLRIKNYETFNFTPREIVVDSYTINKSYSYLTNIRLFNTTIEEEKQVNELLSFFTKDADQAAILDNCDPKMLAPYVSQQR